MPKSPNRAAHALAAAFNLPNQLTSLRLVLAVVMFCAISAQWYFAAFVLFVVAAGTDWLDGYFARKYSLVTTLGRILDPFADKVIICGAFIFLLVPMHEVAGPLQGWMLRAWMVVVIVGRELLVTALRSFFEQRDADFSAKMSGKLKMVLQCIAAGASIFYLWRAGPGPNFVPVADWIIWTTVISTWAAVVATAYSGLAYIWVAYKLVRER